MAEASMPLVDGAHQTGSTLHTRGWPVEVAPRLEMGTVLMIADVYAMHPVSHLATSELLQFVVTADTAIPADGRVAIPIAPAITPPDAHGTPVAGQTVLLVPSDGAAIMVL